MSVQIRCCFGEALCDLLRSGLQKLLDETLEIDAMRAVKSKPGSCKVASRRQTKRLAVLSRHVRSAVRAVFFFADGTSTVAAFALSPIKDAQQQQGEGCDGRFVQAPPGGARMYEYVQKFPQRLCNIFRGQVFWSTLLRLQLRREVTLQRPVQCSRIDVACLPVEGAGAFVNAGCQAPLFWLWIVASITALHWLKMMVQPRAMEVPE